MSDQDRVSRRSFFRGAFKGLRKNLAEVVEHTLPDAARQFADAFGPERSTYESPALGSTQRPARTVVRPPGALPEPAFLDTCSRCRACVDACPEYCIIPSQPGMAAELGTPYLLPEEAPCTLCHDCVDACPSGALQPFDKESVQIGTAVIEPSHCLVSHGQPCDECIQACPRSGEAIRAEDGFPVVVKDACTGCGYCGAACPAPSRAITIFPIVALPEVG